MCMELPALAKCLTKDKLEIENCTETKKVNDISPKEFQQCFNSSEEDYALQNANKQYHVIASRSSDCKVGIVHLTQTKRMLERMLFTCHVL